MDNEIYFQKLLKSIENNNNAGIKCYLRKLSVLHAILLQKMKLNIEVSIPLFFRQKMKVITGEIVSSNLIGFGYTEIALTALMIKQLKKGDIFVDIGAHYGYEALLASHLVGESGQVISFEPNPVSFAVASKNLKNTRSHLHNYAVGNYNGTAQMTNNDVADSAFNGIVSGSDKKNLIDVKIVSLDVALKNRKKRVSFLKCDVEGFEMEVINGAKELIAKDKPIIVLEADMPMDGKPSQRAIELESFMLQFGYTAYSFDLLANSLEIGSLDGFPVGHANVLFISNEQFIPI